MNYCKVCKVCNQQTQQVPLRKIGSLIMLEHYCPHCEESEIEYEIIEET